jgi:RecB family exonuclease
MDLLGTRMLELLLTPADGGTAYRHLLAPGEARAGFECVGPFGLARRLGRLLGVATDAAPGPDRLAAWARRLDAHDDGRRSYSESRRNDPWGVASHLLRLRDGLRLLGWTGGSPGGSARLADLAALESLAPELPPGHPEVLAALAAELRAFSFPLPLRIRIRIAAPRATFAPLLLSLLDALSRTGAEVADEPVVPAAPADGDLGRLQRALLDPAAPAAALEGDGTFQLLEADTPVEAAELLASELRARDLSRATVVAAAEPEVLDAALARQGLPTIGAGVRTALRPALQVLPLRLALAFRPKDPLRAAELLLLPGAPLPGFVRRRLLAALREMPGLGGPAWLEAVDEAAASAAALARADGLDPGGAEERGREVRDAVDAWFGGEAWPPAEGIPPAAAASLCEHVRGWAGARASGAEKDGRAEDAEIWRQGAAAAATLARMLLARPPGERIPQTALMQLHDLAVGDGAERAPFVGEAGRPAVARDPADVLPGAADVVWWGFVDGAASGAAPEPWTAAERAALEAAGARLPPEGAVRGAEATGWRRAVLLAAERAVLVRWRLAGTEPTPPHPLLDELRTRSAPGTLARCIVSSERVLRGLPSPWTPALAELPPASPIAPRPAFEATVSVAAAGALSATALESLLGCPLQWALKHLASLEPGRTEDIPDGPRLVGSFAHRVLQDMLLGAGRLDVARASADDAAAWAARTFDARVEAEAAPLVRPGREVELAAARTLVEGAAAALVRHLQRGGWRPVEAERPVEGTLFGHPFRGSVDLVVAKDGREGLLDLKRSGTSYRREELEQGRALQLGVYAALLRHGGGPYPPTGYLILDDGQLLTGDAGAFPGGTAVAGPSTHETLNAAAEAIAFWSSILDGGLIPSRREGIPWQEALAAAGLSAPDEKRLHPPPCRFCSYGTLCTARVGEEAAP